MNQYSYLFSKKKGGGGISLRSGVRLMLWKNGRLITFLNGACSYTKEVWTWGKCEVLITFLNGACSYNQTTEFKFDCCGLNHLLKRCMFLHD